MNRETMVIAHRGASALAPHENTLEAFQIAIDLKADMVEFDVRKTSDNILIVFHDETIDGRKIGDMTYNRINDIASKKATECLRLTKSWNSAAERYVLI